MKKTMLVLVMVLSVMLVPAALFAGGEQEAGEGGAPEYNIIIAHGSPENSDGNKTVEYFKQLVEERSGGKIAIENYPAFQLGGIMELDQNVKSGTIQMIVGSIGGMTSRAISALDLPSTYTDIQASRKVLSEGKFIGMIDAGLADVNMKLIGDIVPVGFREISSNKAARNVDELKGLKIRTMEHPLHMAYWKALGANPTPIAFGELYVALQQGLVDAQENPFDTIISSKMYEQAKYLILTHHVMFPSAFAMNLDYFNSLPAEYQDLILTAAKEANVYQFDLALKSNAEAIETLQDAGLEVIEFSDADYAKMKELAAPVFKMVRQDCGDEMVDALLEELEAASK